MTPEERAKVLDVIATADGGCSGCVGDLVKRLALMLPGEPWEAEFGEASYDVIGARKRRVERAEWAALGLDVDAEEIAIYGETTGVADKEQSSG
jgi:hypothetical protein